MRKSIFFFICGILFSVIALEGSVRLMSPLLGPPLVKWNTMEDAKMLKLEEFQTKYQNPKYVFMGDSTALIGFNPVVFDLQAALPGGSSFNAAMNGSEIRQIRDFACGFILKKIHPDNLVILFSNPSMALNSEYGGAVTDVSVLEKYLYIYRYRNTFRDPMTLNTFLRILKFRDTREGLVYRWADNLNEFGYTRYGTTDTKNPDPGWDPKIRTVYESPPLPVLDEAGLKYLIEIRDLAKTNGTNLIIGTVPSLSFNPNYRLSIERIAKNIGVSFIQGNDAVGQGKYFQDSLHLNRDGATEFSKFLARNRS